MTAADLVFDPATHITTDPAGIVVPNVTSVLSEVGVSTDFEDLVCISPRLAAQIAFRCALGSTVHADCHSFDDQDLVWDTLHPQSRPFVEAWACCRSNLRLVPITRERRVYHPLHHYTGIQDGIFRVDPSGRIVLADLKIGDPDDAAAHLQTAAYEGAWLAEHPEQPVDERWAIRLCPDCAIPYRIVNYSARPDAWRDFQMFQACLTVYHQQAGRRKRIA